MVKRMVIMLAIVGALFGGLFGFKAFLGGVIRKSISAQGIPPQTVSTAKAQLSEWQGEFQAVGTLRAVRGADLAPELPGVVTAIHFQSGQEVEEGAPLVQLNNEADVAKLQHQVDDAQSSAEDARRQMDAVRASEAHAVQEKVDQFRASYPTELRFPYRFKLPTDVGVGGD